MNDQRKLYNVVQKGKVLKTFDDITDALRYAKTVKRASVYNDKGQLLAGTRPAVELFGEDEK